MKIWQKLENHNELCPVLDNYMVTTYQNTITKKYLSFYIGYKGGLTYKDVDYEPARGGRHYFSASFYDGIADKEYPWINMELCEILRLFRETMHYGLQEFLNNFCRRFEAQVITGFMGIKELEVLAYIEFYNLKNAENAIKLIKKESPPPLELKK